MNVSQSQAFNIQMEKKLRQCEKSNDEWKKRVSEMQADLDKSQKEDKQHAAESQRLEWFKSKFNSKANVV